MAHSVSRGQTPVHQILTDNDNLPASGLISVAFGGRISSFSGSDRFFCKEANGGAQDFFWNWTAFGFGGNPSIGIEYVYSGGNAGALYSPPTTAADHHFALTWNVG